MRKLSILVSLIFAALIRISLAAPNESLPASCLLEALSQIAFTSNTPELRPESQVRFWKRYRNDDTFALWVASQPSQNDYVTLLHKFEALNEASKPKGRIRPNTVNLSENCNGEFCTKPPPFLNTKIPENLTNYEKRVLSLRKGDRVIFEVTESLNGVPTVIKKEFVLDDFLGAGNQTQIWGIQGDPTRALRIPFRTLNHRPPYFVESFLRDLRESIGVLKRPNYFEKDAKFVRIYEVGPQNEYAIVQRINGDLNAFEFLESSTTKAVIQHYQQTLSKFRQMGAHIPGATEVPIRSIAAKLQISEEVVASILDKWNKFNIASKQHAGHPDFSSMQLLWDQDRLDWILVDR